MLEAGCKTLANVVAASIAVAGRRSRAAPPLAFFFLGVLPGDPFDSATSVADCVFPLPATCTGLALLFLSGIVLGP